MTSIFTTVCKDIEYRSIFSIFFGSGERKAWFICYNEHGTSSFRYGKLSHIRNQLIKTDVQPTATSEISGWSLFTSFIFYPSLSFRIFIPLIE